MMNCRILYLIVFCFSSIYLKGQLDSLQQAYDASDDLYTRSGLLIKMAEIQKNKENYDSAYILLEKSAFISAENSQNIREEAAFDEINQSLGIMYGILALFASGLAFAFAFIRLKSKHNRALESKNKIIEEAMSEKETLLREIHHRVKNNLQIVSSILSLQGRYTDDPQIESAIREGKDRVTSMSLIHQNLYQKDNLKGVDVQDYFIKLFSSLFDSYNIQPEKIDLELDIAPINLDVDTIVPIGLVVNELVSNALKHAFPEDRKGIVSVSLTESNDSIILIVEDDGVGLDVLEINENKSMGYTLIETFKNKLNAQVEIDSIAGTKITLQIKKYKKVA